MYRQIRSQVSRGFVTVSLWCIGAVIAALVSQLASADEYRAFYYDAQGKLLQVEDVPDHEAATRALESVNESALVVPLLTGRDYPMISGNSKQMHKSAELAVYYTFNKATPPSVGDKDVQALPTKVEYLGFIEKRHMAKCLPRDGSQPCIFPKRCHCMTGACCCY